MRRHADFAEVFAGLDSRQRGLILDFIGAIPAEGEETSSRRTEAKDGGPAERPGDASSRLS